MKNVSKILCALLIAALFPVGLEAAQATLKWNDNATNETGTTIERAPGLDATTGWAVVANVPASAAETTGKGERQYVDTTVKPLTAYSYRVRAFNTAGASGYSNTASGTTRDDPPTGPTGNTFSVPGDYVPPEVTVSAVFTVRGAQLTAANIEAKPAD